MNTNGYYRFRLGAFSCLCLCDGSYDYPLNSIFSNAPAAEVEAALRQRNLPTDYITTPYTNLLVDTKTRRVLVDLGAGSLAPRTGKLRQNMVAAGIEPATIDTVVITHAHPDHIGGMLDEHGNLNFPNADYYVSKVEWDFWFSGDALQLAPEMFVNIARRNLKPIRGRVKLVDEDQELMPGVSTIQTPGHTPGHMAVEFASGNQVLLYIGDVVLHPLHLAHPDWIPIYDLLLEQAATSKYAIFDLAADRQALVVGQHFPPFPSLGTVNKETLGWGWKPVSC